jgi:hypothetical protein
VTEMAINALGIERNVFIKNLRLTLTGLWFLVLMPRLNLVHVFSS